MRKEMFHAMMRKRRLFLWRTSPRTMEGWKDARGRHGEATSFLTSFGLMHWYSSNEYGKDTSRVDGYGRSRSNGEEKWTGGVAIRDFKHELNRVTQDALGLTNMVKDTVLNDRQKQLQEKADRSDLWDHPIQANAILQELGQMQELTNQAETMVNELQDLQELYDMAQLENDVNMLQECKEMLEQLMKRASNLRIKLLLSKETDPWSCFIEIQAGSGGTESCDWVRMLLRMYTRWAIQRDYKADISSESLGETVGYRSVVLRVEGAYAYGWSKTEAGTHRLIRISPFDGQGRRHTSFAQVRVYPLNHLNSSLSKINIINPKDIRIDTFRASGAGGQHVNKTDSAIRITHNPSGIVVQCQSDRSQHRNKAVAMDMLRAKLEQKALEEELKERYQHTIGLGENTWGNQIRSYVLHPYQMVKDHRTYTSTSDTIGVLDGALDDFMEAILTWQSQETPSTPQ